jgi:Fe-Mn family superoxide dismutase
MEHKLPQLPYPKNALEPHLSAETLEYHHGKHHRAYVTKLNELIRGTEYEEMDLVDLVLSSAGPVFDNAAQHWNHTFFWSCLAPNGAGTPAGELADLLTASFGSFERFKEEFAKAAAANFGSGWTWLVRNDDGALEIMNTSNADNPLRHGKKPLLTLDVWEHAYYIDYRNSRSEYITHFWNLANWEFAAANLSRELSFRAGPTEGTELREWPTA